MPTVYVTAPRDAAQDLARAAVDHRLAACANVVDCTSTYRWEGTIEEGVTEAILLLKTSNERYTDLADWLAAEHPYEVPCIERFDEGDVSDPFADWIATETTSDDT